MSFNLKAKRQRRLIQQLRSLSDDCQHLRPSDLDGLSEKDMYHIYHNLHKKASIKTALHGMGETWTPQDVNYDPYRTSPLVNNQGPEFGGRWRRDMPGSGDQHINDDGDKDKNTKGDNANGDFDPNSKAVIINDVLDKIRGPKYTVKLRLSEEDEPSKSKAKEIFGEDAETDGKEAIWVVCDSFENAIGLQRKVPRSIIEQN